MLTEIKHNKLITMNVNYVTFKNLQQQRKLITMDKNKINKTLTNTSIKAENIQIKCN